MDHSALIKTIGINEVPAISKLIELSQDETWNGMKARGIGSIEICTLIAPTQEIADRMAEQAKHYKANLDSYFAKIQSTDDLSNMEALVNSIRACELEVYSCHLMGAGMYPAYIVQCIPFIRAIHKKLNISNFVISLNLESIESVQEFIPCVEAAAKELSPNGITLCYHNHHMDSTRFKNGKSPIEMMMENCPHLMIQLDTGWAWYGGMNPVQFIKDNYERIASLHLKDLTDDSREREDKGKFTAIGYGATPIRECLEAMDLCKLKEGMLIIDQDESAGDMFDDVEKGVKFVKKCLMQSFS